MISVHPDRAWVKPAPPAPVKVIDGVLVKRFSAKPQRVHTFAQKGSMTGGRAGATKGVTSCIGGSRWAD